MTKTIITISIEHDIVEQFKRQVGKGNVSKSIADFMQKAILRSSATIAPQDVELLEIEYTRLKEESNNIISALQIVEAERQRIKDAAIEQTKADLEAEKERIENAHKCFNCGNLLGFKKHHFSKGDVCTACFLSANSELVKLWSG